MRIVYLSGSGQLGGAERCLLDVLESLRREAPSWELVLLASRDGPLVARARAIGVHSEIVPMPERVAELGDSVAQGRTGRLWGLGARALRGSRSLLAYRRALRTALKHHAPDIVHTNGYKMHIMGAWSRPVSTALIWHLHDYASSRPLMAHAIRQLSRRCDAAVAVSNSVARDVAPIWRGRSPVAVVLNAVDLDAFQPDGSRADLDALAGLPPAPASAVRVGLVATMGRFKGHETFLRAVATLPAELPVRAYVVGGALYETRGSEVSLDGLRVLARELGIADRVGFTGFVDDPASAMRSLDVVVHATTTPEPFGLVIAEGMACGRAVIASAAGGAGEIVEAGVDALTHPPGDVRALGAAIRRLASDAALRARLGSAARRSAEVRFDRWRIGGQVAAVYRAAMAARHGQRTVA